MKYYQHNQTTPVYYKGHKLTEGCEYMEDDVGNVTVKKNGEVVYTNIVTVEKGKLESEAYEVHEVKEKRLKDDRPVENNPDFNNLTKRELETFVKKKYGIDLDLRKNRKSLMTKIKELMKGDK